MLYKKLLATFICANLIFSSLSLPLIADPDPTVRSFRPSVTMTRTIPVPPPQPPAPKIATNISRSAVSYSPLSAKATTSASITASMTARTPSSIARQLPSRTSLVPDPPLFQAGSDAVQTQTDSNQKDDEEANSASQIHSALFTTGPRILQTFPTQYTARTANLENDSAGDLLDFNDGTAVVYGQKRQSSGGYIASAGVLNPVTGVVTNLFDADKIYAGNVSLNGDTAVFVYDNLTTKTVMVYDVTTKTSRTFTPNLTNGIGQTSQVVAAATDSQKNVYLLTKSPAGSSSTRNTLIVFNANGQRIAMRDFNFNGVETSGEMAYARIDIGSEGNLGGNPKSVLNIYGIGNNGTLFANHTFEAITTGVNLNLIDRGPIYTSVSRADKAVLVDRNFFVLTTASSGTASNSTLVQTVAAGRVISTRTYQGHPANPMLGHITIFDSANGDFYTFTSDGIQQYVGLKGNSGDTTSDLTNILRQQVVNGSNDDFRVRGGTYGKIAGVDHVILSLDQYKPGSLIVDHIFVTIPATDWKNLVLTTPPLNIQFTPSLINVRFHSATYQVTLGGFDANRMDAKLVIGTNLIPVIVDSNGRISYTVNGLAPGSTTPVKTRVTLKSNPNWMSESGVTQIQTRTLPSMTSNFINTPSQFSDRISFDYTVDPQDLFPLGARVLLAAPNGNQTTHDMNCFNGKCSIELVNLAYGSSYRAIVTLYNANNRTESAILRDFTFQTLNSGITFQGVRAENVGEDYATILGNISGLWGETGFIDYKEDTANSTWQRLPLSSLDPGTGAFSRLINNLRANTPYLFKVVVRSSANVETVSDTFSFRTLPPLSITGVTLTNVSRRTTVVEGTIEGLVTSDGQIGQIVINSPNANPRIFNLTVGSNNRFTFTIPQEAILPNSSFYIRVVDRNNQPLRSINSQSIPIIPIPTEGNPATALVASPDSAKLYGNIALTQLTQSDRVEIVTTNQTTGIAVISVVPRSDYVNNFGLFSVDLRDKTPDTQYTVLLRVVEGQDTYNLQSTSFRTLPALQHNPSVSALYTYSGDTVTRVDDGNFKYKSTVEDTKTLVYMEAVTRFYEEYLNRAPDPAGLNHWVNILLQGETLGRVAEAFRNSSEFLSRTNVLPQMRLINELYLLHLGRNGDTPGLTSWQQQLQVMLLGGLSLNQALANIENGFLQSSEYENRIADIQARWPGADPARIKEVTNFYVNVLGIVPTNYEVALTLSTAPQPPADFFRYLVIHFMNKDSFKDKFNQLITFFTGRPSDPGTTALLSRNDYLQSFIHWVLAGNIAIDRYFHLNLRSAMLINSRNGLAANQKLLDSLGNLIETVFTAGATRHAPRTTIPGQTNVFTEIGGQNTLTIGSTLSVQLESTDADGGTFVHTYELFRSTEGGPAVLFASGRSTDGIINILIPDDGTYRTNYTFALNITTTSFNGRFFGGENKTFIRGIRVGPYNNNLPPSFSATNNRNYGYRWEPAGTNIYKLRLYDRRTGETRLMDGTVTSALPPVFRSLSSDVNTIVYSIFSSADPSAEYPEKIVVRSFSNAQKSIEWTIGAPVTISFSTNNSAVTISNSQTNDEIVTVDLLTFQHNLQDWTFIGEHYAYRISSRAGRNILEIRFLPTGKVEKVDDVPANSLIVFRSYIRMFYGGWQPLIIWAVESPSEKRIVVQHLKNTALRVSVDGLGANPEIEAATANFATTLYLSDRTNNNNFRVVSLFFREGAINPNPPALGLELVPKGVSDAAMNFFGSLQALKSSYSLGWDKSGNDWIISERRFEVYGFGRFSMRVENKIINGTSIYRLGVVTFHHLTPGGTIFDRSKDIIFYFQYDLNGTLEHISRKLTKPNRWDSTGARLFLENGNWVMKIFGPGNFNFIGSVDLGPGTLSLYIIFLNSLRVNS